MVASAFTCIVWPWSMFTLQDHDHRVAETAVVGFPHDTYGEGEWFNHSDYIYKPVVTCCSYTYSTCVWPV